MISHFIVLTTFGQIFFSKEFGEETGVDVALTGGLISAIYSMTTETQREKITDMELEDKKIIFQEAGKDLLFVLTVDKRMDDTDAKELLNALAVRFMEKYGDIQIDGMILSDFEQDVDQIVNKRIWYTNMNNKKLQVWDYLAFIWFAFLALWVPMQAFATDNVLFSGYSEFGLFYFPPLLRSGTSFIVAVLNTFIYGLIAWVIPLLFGYWLLKKATVFSFIYRFFFEILKRPTRSAYVTLLPNSFMLPTIQIVIFGLATSYFGKGIIWELKTLPIDAFIESGLARHNPPAVYWSLLLFVTFTTFTTWIYLFPFLIMLFQGQFDKSVYFNLIKITSIPTLFLVFLTAFGGAEILVLFNFHPENIVLFSQEARSPLFLLLVTIPLNLLLIAFVFYMAISSLRIIGKNQLSFALAFVLSFFSVLLIQKLVYWIIFESGFIYVI